MLKVLKFLPFYGLAILPFPLLYLVSDFVFVLVFYIVRYRRNVVWTNLSNSFPNRSDHDLRTIERDFYRHFCDLFLESFKLLTISEKEIQKRAVVKNPELIKQLEEENKRVIWYMSHMGNWEWFTSFTSRMKYEVLTLYKRQSSSYFDDLILLMRSRFGSTMVPMKLGYRVLIKMLNEQTHVGCCIIGDQTPTFKKSRVHWTTFLNQETPFIMGAEEMARRTDQVLLFPIVSKPARGHYLVEYQKMDADPAIQGDITESYARMLEKSIRANPSIWLWTHRRWKKKRK